MFSVDKRYEVNPQRTKYKMKRIGYADHVEVVSKRTGEVRDTVAVVNEPVEIDATEFIKVYSPTALLALSITAVRLFLYLISEMSYDGTVEVDTEKIASELGYKSDKSIRNGIKELRDCDCIRRKDLKEFWINPNIACKGTRKLS